MAPALIQDFIKEYVLKQTYFAQPTPIVIVTEDDGDIETKVLAATCSLGGMALLILVPVGNSVDPGKSGGVFSLEIEIHCIESPLINRAVGGLNKPAYVACRKLLSPVGNGGLDGWDPGVPFTKFVALGYDATSSKIEGQGLIIYTTKFRCSEVIAFESEPPNILGENGGGMGF